MRCRHEHRGYRSTIERVDRGHASLWFEANRPATNQPTLPNLSIISNLPPPVSYPQRRTAARPPALLCSGSLRSSAPPPRAPGDPTEKGGEKKQSLGHGTRPPSGYRARGGAQVAPRPPEPPHAVSASFYLFSCSDFAMLVVFIRGAELFLEIRCSAMYAYRRGENLALEAATIKPPLLSSPVAPGPLGRPPSAPADPFSPTSSPRSSWTATDAG